MAMADIWRVLDKRSNARRTNRWRHFPYNHWHTGNGIFFMHCTLHRTYYVMVRPSVQPGRSGNFQVELKTRFLTEKAIMAWYYNVISRRELRFKRLVVLRGTAHMSAWQEAQKCAAKGHQVRAILLHSYEINSCCTHQEARWQNQRIRNLPETEVKKRPACEGGATDRDRLLNSSGLTLKSYTVISYSLKNGIVKEEIEIQFFCLFPYLYWQWYVELYCLVRCAGNH